MFVIDSCHLWLDFNNRVAGDICLKALILIFLSLYTLWWEINILIKDNLNDFKWLKDGLQWQVTMFVLNIVSQKQTAFLKMLAFICYIHSTNCPIVQIGVFFSTPFFFIEQDLYSRINRPTLFIMLYIKMKHKCNWYNNLIIGIFTEIFAIIIQCQN